MHVIANSECRSLWKWPDIEGLDSFDGKRVHSANWDHSYDYSNKRIGLIGNGSSGIQILPQMAKLPGTEVTSFQRGPTWVVSRMSAGSLLGKDIKDYNPVYTEEDKKRFREDPAFHNEYRKKLIHNINNAFKMVSTDLGFPNVAAPSFMLTVTACIVCERQPTKRRYAKLRRQADVRKVEPRPRALRKADSEVGAGLSTYYARRRLPGIFHPSQCSPYSEPHHQN